MKKLYFAFFILLFAGKLAAQPYFPMLDSSNEWSYTAQMVAVRLAPAVQSAPCTYPIPPAYSPFKHYTTSDTVINSNTYKIVMNSLMTCTMGYIREDSAAQKVYFLDNVSSSEFVLYDFSMSVGNTMGIMFMSGGGYASGTYTLDSITTVTIFAGNRRAFHLNCHSAPFSPTLTWIESVGNLTDLLYPYFDNNTGPGLYNNCPEAQHQFSQFMICFDHDYKVYFDNCSYTLTQNNPSSSSFTDSCDYYSFIGAVNEIYTTAGFDIFPNPTNGKSAITFDAACESNYDVYIWDMEGRMLAKQISLGRLQEGKNTMTIDFSELKNGMYIVEIRSVENSLYNKVQLRN
jgi:hypothetical protein